MPTKLGNGGHSQETYDPNTGKYTDRGNISNQEEKQILNSMGLGDSDFEENGPIDIDWDDLDYDDFKYLDGQLSSKNTDNEYGFDMIDGEHSIEIDVNVINPHYSTRKKEYTRNCASCQLAYEMRRRGYDVEAKERSELMAYGGTFASYENFSWNATKSQRRETQLIELKDTLLKEGDSRWVIRCTWSKYNGHVFNAEVKDGKLYFIDSQSQKIAESNNSSFIDYYAQIWRPTDLRFGRIDDKKIKKFYAQEACRNRKK